MRWGTPAEYADYYRRNYWLTRRNLLAWLKLENPDLYRKVLPLTEKIEREARSEEGRQP